MLILAQANELSNFPTTLLGLVGLALALIINDWVKNRGKNLREESKVSELTNQTRIMGQQLEMLQSIRDGQEYEGIKSKKLRKRIKLISQQVKELHDKHINPNETK